MQRQGVPDSGVNYVRTVVPAQSTPSTLNSQVPSCLPQGSVNVSPNGLAASGNLFRVVGTSQGGSSLTVRAEGHQAVSPVPDGYEPVIQRLQPNRIVSHPGFEQPGGSAYKRSNSSGGLSSGGLSYDTPQIGGSDLGPQISRPATGKKDAGSGRALAEGNPSLAAFASGNLSALARQQGGTPLKHRVVPSSTVSTRAESDFSGRSTTPNTPGRPRFLNPSARADSDVSSDCRRIGENSELPTLRQLVMAGTGAPASSAVNVGMVGTTAPAASTAGLALPGSNRSNRSLAPTTVHQENRPGSQYIIAVDVDEVLVHYVDSFRKFLQRERPNGPLDTDSVFHEAHNPQSPWRLQFALSGGLDNLDAVPGAASSLRRLRQAGIRLEIVTSRPPIMRESTEALLGRLFPSDTFAAAHFVGAGQKGATCNAIGACALIDDQLPNCVDACSCGVMCILFDFCGSYPWSQNVSELPPGCKRIETWAEACNCLLTKLGMDPTESMVPASTYLLPMREERTSDSGKQALETHADLDATLECTPVPATPECHAPKSQSNLSNFEAQPQTSPASLHSQVPKTESWWQTRIDTTIDSPTLNKRAFSGSDVLQSSPGVDRQPHHVARSALEATLDPHAGTAFRVDETGAGYRPPSSHYPNGARESLAAWSGPGTGNIGTGSAQQDPFLSPSAPMTTPNMPPPVREAQASPKQSVRKTTEDDLGCTIA